MREQSISQNTKRDHNKEYKLKINLPNGPNGNFRKKRSPESRVEKIYNDRSERNNKQGREGDEVRNLRAQMFDNYGRYNRESNDSESTRSEQRSFVSSDYTYDSEYDTFTDDNSYASDSYESYTDGSTFESVSDYSTVESSQEDHYDSSDGSEASTISDEGRNRKRVVQFKDTIEIKETIESNYYEEDRECDSENNYPLHGIINSDPILWQCLRELFIVNYRRLFLILSYLIIYIFFRFMIPTEPIDEKKETSITQEGEKNSEVGIEKSASAIEQRSILKLDIGKMLMFPCGLPQTNFLVKNSNVPTMKTCLSAEPPNIEMTLSAAETVRDRSAFVESTEKLPLDNDAAIRELTDAVQVVRIDQWSKHGNGKMNGSVRSGQSEKASKQPHSLNHSWTSFTHESQGSNSSDTHNTKNISLFHGDIENSFKGSEFAPLSNDSSLTSTLYNTKVDLYKSKVDDNDSRLNAKKLRKSKGSFRRKLNRTKRRHSHKLNESFDLSSAGTLSNLSHESSSNRKKASIRGSITRMKKKVRQKRFGKRNDDCYLLLNEEEYVANDQEKNIVIDPFSNSFHQSKS